MLPVLRKWNCVDAEGRATSMWLSFVHPCTRIGQMGDEEVAGSINLVS